MKRTSYILLSLLIPSLASCNLEEQPVAQTGKDAIFENEEGLVLYTNSLYDTPPSHGWRSRSDGYGFGCFTGAIDYFSADYDGAANAGQLYYGTPRACNYFLENNTSAKVPESVRNNYNGIARYFLANWYAYMVLAYSDIPLVDHVVDVKETDVLYGPRDPRTKVAEFVYDNYKYALDNIAALYESSASTITKNVVAFQMAKYCLYEGSWRKYHSDLGLGSTANEWFQRAVDAAEVVINSGKQSLHSNWGEIFTAASPETVSDEGIFIYRYGQGINSYHNTTKCENSPSFLGGPTCKSRYLVNMFLNADGSRFTDNPNYESMNFIDECKNRDPRFAMTFRTPTYMRTQTDGTRHHAGLEMVTAISIMVYSASFMFSWGPICWVLIAEIFPNTIRGGAVAIAVAFQWIFNFIVSSTFVPMFNMHLTEGDDFGHWFTYGLYGIICVIAAVFVWKLVPETKGKTLEDMTKLWKKNK